MFEGLLCNPENTERRRVWFENDFGLSIIRGQFTYGESEGLYEVALIHGSEDKYILAYVRGLWPDVKGHQTLEDIEKLEAEVRNYPADMKYEFSVIWGDE